MDKVWEWETHEAVDTLKQCGILLGMTVMDFGCELVHDTIPASITTGLEGKEFILMITGINVQSFLSCH